MADAPIRVAVVDDHQVFADAISVRLSEERDIEVVGSALNGAEACALLEATDADVVALDLALGAEDGLELARTLLRRWPDLQVVLVTGIDADDRCLEALRSGVHGWVTKTDPVSV